MEGSQSTYLAVVLGNTTLRWQLRRKGRSVAGGSQQVESPAPAELRSGNVGVPVYVASVNPPRTETLRHELNRPFVLLGRDLPVPIHNATSRPEQVGVDRLLVALGGFLKAGPCIVVDAGTAITVNCVGEGPVFRGGAIFPGLSLLARALHTDTAQLPQVTIAGAPPSATGSTTEQAIACGVTWGLIGAVRLLVERMRSPEPELPVVVTGGASQFLLPHLRGTVIAEPELIFQGMSAAIEAAR